MKHELPQGWTLCTLGDVVRVQNGYAFPSREFRKTGVPVIRQGNLGGNKVSLNKCVYLDPEWLEKKSEFVLRKDDVLIGMSGSVGKLCVYDLDGPALQNQRTGKIVPRVGECIDWRFVWEHLKTVEQQLLEKGKGMGVLNISATDIESLPFRFPPLNEQRRIAAKLEKLLSRVEGAQARFVTIPRILKRFRQSVLAAACSGRLTADWRSANMLSIKRSKQNNDNIPSPIDGQSDLPITWTIRDLENLLQANRDISYGVVKPGLHDPNGIRVLKSGQVRNGTLDLSEDFRITKTLDKEYARTRLQGGELLLNLVGASIGRSAIAPPELRGSNVTRAIAVIPVKVELVEWVQLNLQGPVGQNLIRGKTGGSAQPVLNLSEVRTLSIPMPSLNEQQEIVRRVEALFKTADALEARYRKAKAHVDKLTQSILAKAFRGELVPQDPNDEPARTLLERLREHRRDEPKLRRSKYKR